MTKQDERLKIGTEIHRIAMEIGGSPLPSHAFRQNQVPEGIDLRLEGEQKT